MWESVAHTLGTNGLEPWASSLKSHTASLSKSQNCDCQSSNDDEVCCVKVVAPYIVVDSVHSRYSSRQHRQEQTSGSQNGRLR